ncbi:type II secretion system protein [Paenibacillus sp. TAF43_2]|uniref:type II secretion system protein n=1 Tax=Paenibacillus sp. TAF43_2 TaxID=3233069 RepID=UPI003F9D2330
MQMLLKRFKKEEKGFTLIELLAVIVILAVIAVIAVPLIGNIISKTKGDADVATARQVYDAARLYVTSELNGDFKGKKIKVVGNSTTEGLVSKGYLEPQIMLPSNKEPLTNGEVIFDGNGNLTSVTLATGGTAAAPTIADGSLLTGATDNITTAGNKLYIGATVLKSGK